MLPNMALVLKTLLEEGILRREEGDLESQQVTIYKAISLPFVLSWSQLLGDVSQEGTMLPSHR